MIKNVCKALITLGLLFVASPSIAYNPGFCPALTQGERQLTILATPDAESRAMITEILNKQDYLKVIVCSRVMDQMGGNVIMVTAKSREDLNKAKKLLTDRGVSFIAPDPDSYIIPDTYQ